MRFLINAIISSLGTLFCVLEFCCCYIFWKNRSETSIHQRKPSLVCSIGILNILITAVLWWGIFTQITCELIVYCYWSELWFVFAPLFLRGVQYVVMTNDEYRKRFGTFLKNKRIFHCSLVLSLLQYIYFGISLFIMRNSHRNCLMSWHAIYTGLILMGLITLTPIISSKIPWNFDSYGIGREIKLCFIYWIILGGCALTATTFLGLFQLHVVYWKQTINSFIVASNVCTFLTVVVSPLWQVGKIPSFKRSKYVKKKICPHFESQLNFQGYTSFCEIFTDITATDALHMFSKQHLVPEMTLFLQQIWKYRMKGANQTTEQRFRQYLKILSYFVDENSNYCVNLSSSSRELTLKYMSAYDHFSKLSLDAQISIFDLSFQEISDKFCSRFQEELMQDVSEYTQKA